MAEKNSLAISTNFRTPSTGDSWETGPEKYSDLSATSQHGYNGDQAYGPQPCMRSSKLSPGSYRFNPEPQNAVIPLSDFTIARAHTRLDDDAWTGPRPGKRGPFTDPSLRQETAHTRRIGCCIRCRMQRIRVSSQRMLTLEFNMAIC